MQTRYGPVSLRLTLTGGHVDCYDAGMAIYLLRIPRRAPGFRDHGRSIEAASFEVEDMEAAKREAERPVGQFPAGRCGELSDRFGETIWTGMPRGMS